MQQRDTKRGIIGVVIAMAVMSMSVSEPAVSKAPAMCQEQDVVAAVAGDNESTTNGLVVELPA